MNTPTPSASGAHTRVQLKRPDFVIEVHATIEAFDRETGDFTAWLDTDPQGTSAEAFTLNVDPSALQKFYTDSKGFVWEVVR